MNPKSGIHITEDNRRPKHWLARRMLIAGNRLVIIRRCAWACPLCIAMLLMLAFSPGAVNGQTRALRAGVYQNEPKIFMDANGQPAGIFIELLNEIAAQESWTLAYVPCEWQACLQALADGQIDLLPDVAYSPERDATYDFHKTPVLESWSRVYASPDTPIIKISDLDGKRVAVLQGSIQQTVFEQLMNGFGYKVTMIPTDSFAQAFALAEDGAADAAIANHLFGDYFYQKYGLLKKAIDFNPVTLYYATAEGRNPDLLNVIDRYLDKWLQEPNSPYYATLGRWSEKEPAYHAPQYVFWIIGGIFGLLLAAAGMILLLRRQVKLRTRHLEQANAQLQESQQRYQTLARISPVGIFLTDAHGATTYVNPKYCAISGLSAEQALGNGWLDTVHPDDKEKLSQGWQESVQQHQASFADYRFVRPDGTLAWVMGQTAPEMNAEHETVGYVGTITDITERKQAEASLRESETRFSTIFHASPAAIAITRFSDNQFMDVNKAWQAMTGYTRAEVEGHTLAELNLWANPEQRQRLIETLRAQGTARDEIQIRRKSGETGDVLMSVEMIELAGVQYLLTMAQDITERKQAEAQLADQLDELRRWHQATLGRETRILDLKREVNELLRRLNEPPRYPSAEDPNGRP